MASADATIGRTMDKQAFLTLTSRTPEEAGRFSGKFMEQNKKKTKDEQLKAAGSPGTHPTAPFMPKFDVST
jgi:hypothetical protein